MSVGSILGADGKIIANFLPASAIAGVESVVAGTGITIGGTASDPIVNNAGVLSVSAGTGISVGGTASAPVINVSGLPTSFRLPAASAFTPSGTVTAAGSGALTPISANFTVTANRFYRLTGTMSLTATATTDQIGLSLNGVSIPWWVWTPQSTEIAPAGSYSVGWTTFFKAETTTATVIVLENNQSSSVDITLDVVSGAVPGFLLEEWETLPDAA
jgi:hypothetical protein